jgi:hypothetical protein
MVIDAMAKMGKILSKSQKFPKVPIMEPSGKIEIFGGSKKSANVTS